MSKSTRLRTRLSHDDLVRYRTHVLVTASCHVWLGAVGSDGYGKFSIRNKIDGERVISPQQVSARLKFGPMPLGSTLMHDCDVRVCVSTAPGHVRVSTQGENMRQAAWRGRAVGPRPGRVDTRGKVGASRAVQAALRDHLAAHPDADPDELAAILAACLAEGDPLRGMVALFDPPPARPVLLPDDFPVDLLDLIACAPAPQRVRRVESVALFEVT